MQFVLVNMLMAIILWCKIRFFRDEPLRCHLSFHFVLPISYLVAMFLLKYVLWKKWAEVDHLTTLRAVGLYLHLPCIIASTYKLSFIFYENSHPCPMGSHRVSVDLNVHLLFTYASLSYWTLRPSRHGFYVNPSRPSLHPSVECPCVYLM